MRGRIDELLIEKIKKALKQNATKHDVVRNRRAEENLKIISNNYKR